MKIQIDKNSDTVYITSESNRFRLDKVKEPSKIEEILTFIFNELNEDFADSNTGIELEVINEDRRHTTEWPN